MKILSFILLSFLVACSHHTPEKVQIGNLKNAHKYKYIVLADQPDEQTIKQLPNHGIKTVINLRDHSEIKFDEKKIVEDAGLNYVNVPFVAPGIVEKGNVDKVYQSIKKYKSQGDVLVHCSSGNRAAAWFGAHFYIHHRDSEEKSIEVARKAGMNKDSMEKELKAFIDRN